MKTTVFLPFWDLLLFLVYCTAPLSSTESKIGNIMDLTAAMPTWQISKET
jgi:hypothetical protein